MNEAEHKARQLAKLDLSAYAATKLRLREPLLTGMRKALEMGDAMYRERR